MKKYTVTLSRVEYLSATVEVEAENEDAAREYAMDEAEFELFNAEQSVEEVVETH